MTRLQSQSSASSSSRRHLNILKASRFWNIILCAIGNVAKLNSHPFIKDVKASINELGILFVEKVIDMQLLQQILEYDDEKLFRCFDVAVKKNIFSSGVIVYREEIVKVRKIYDEFIY